MSARRWRVVALVLTLMATLVPAAGAVAEDPELFFSEIHYDNDSTDTGEAIEVTGPAGTDVTGWQIVLYNGNGGAVYDAAVLNGVIPAGGAFTVSFGQIQNGSPDGFALVAPDDTVVEFLSYEGTFTAVGGAADGLLSVDIGVEEGSTTPIGHSLQRTAVDAPWFGPEANTFAPPLDPVDPGDPGDESPIYFSEIHYDNVGGDTGEAVEVTGPAGTDMTGWQIVPYNGANGLTYSIATLVGQIPDEGAFTVYIAGLQNGSPDGIALVDPAATVIEFLSYEGAFAATNGPAAGMISVDIGVEEDGSTAIGDSLQKVDGVWVGPQPNTFAPELEPLPIPFLKVHEVQGSGSASPYDGLDVTVEAVVVGTAPGLNGFWIQEEDADVDGNDQTSEGIFVFSPGGFDAQTGDQVRVTGTVDEFFGLTELTFVTVEVLESGVALPTPATVTFPVTAIADLEAYEGMLATFPQSLVISEYFNFDRFGEVVVALPAAGEDRPFTPSAVFEPGTEAAARADLNERSRITVDDFRGNQNPDPAIHPGNGEVFDLTNLFRGGETITGVTGPIHYSFDLYRVMPTDYGAYDDTLNPRPEAPDEVGGDVKVGALNVLNFFTTLDQGPDSCGPAQNLECRGADNATEFERQRAKILAALEGMDTDVVGLIEMENTTGVEPMDRIVDGLDGYEYIHTGTIGSDAIKVGIIYRPETVTPIGDHAILDSSVDARFLDEKNRPVLAQSFVENASGEIFTVAVNHLKSKGSACDDVGDPFDPFAGNCNGVRTAAAEAMVDWLESDPTDSGDTDYLIIGDLNSYDKEDPISVLRDAGYTDLLDSYVGEYAYTYVFDGQFGYLDYALSSSSLTSQVTGATAWNINADEPDLIDYDTSFKGPNQDAIFAPDAYRSSDHDPVIVGLDLDAAADAEPFASPDTLWPPNHQYRPVTVGVADGSVAILDATSSEADSGLGDDDVPVDIVITSDTTLDLRAERYARAGRTYTVDLYVRLDIGQAKLDTARVLVPLGQGRGPRVR